MEKVDENVVLLEPVVGGLSHKEAADRLARNGKNVITGKKKISPLVRFLLQFGNIMVIILIISGGISLVLGVYEHSISEVIDGFVIFAIVIFNAFFGYLQENKAMESIESLQKMSGSFSLVRREGEIIRISSENIVVGDTLILEAGMVLAADVVLTETHSLMIDESAFSGESVPVTKSHKKTFSGLAPLGDRQDEGFSGTTVVYGRGEGVVFAVGNNTDIGKIATLVQSEVDEKTPLEKSLNSISKIITLIVLCTAAFIFLFEIFLKPDTKIIEAFMTAVAISVSAIPESLPAVITIIMALGVTRLAKQKAIVKKLHAVETLGCCDVICSDKTGTLTENNMTVKKLFASDKIYDDSFEFTTDTEMLIRSMILCNDTEKNHGGYVGDPTEVALIKFAEKYGYTKTVLDKENQRISEIPFDSGRKLMTTLNNVLGVSIQHTKGGVDELLKRCTKVLINGKVEPLTEEKILNIKKVNRTFAAEALRVLAYAIKPLKAGEIEATESDMIFVGLSGLIDPPRKEVEAAVRKCVRAGMRAVMITGDHKHTAFAIASQIGIASKEEEVMTGEELDKLSEDELILRLDKIRVFARVSPNHKVKIVNAFKKIGKVVAMTGDGVNDAPAIKAANIGVGMGITGTDITKEAADIIVSDDNFATIVLAVEEGRKIYRNIQKTVRYLFTTNFAEIFSLFVATLVFPLYTFLLPLQILFVNLITDSLPAIALGVEPPEKNLMLEPPRQAAKNIFAGGVGLGIIIQGLFQTIILIGIYTYGLFTSVPVVASTMVFYTLNIMQTLHLLSVRTSGSVFASNPFKNKLAIWAIGVSLASMLLLIFTPLGMIFKLVDLTESQWLFVLGFAVLIVPLNEFYRLIRKAFKKSKTAKKNKKVKKV